MNTEEPVKSTEEPLKKIDKRRAVWTPERRQRQRENMLIIHAKGQAHNDNNGDKNKMSDVTVLPTIVDSKVDEKKKKEIETVEPEENEVEPEEQKGTINPFWVIMIGFLIVLFLAKETLFNIFMKKDK